GEYKAAYHAGYAYLKEQDFKQALHYTELALKTHPYFTNALYNRAVILERSTEYKLAEIAYNKVLNLDSECGDCWNNLGVLKQRSHQFEESENAFRNAVKSNPGKPEYHNNLGIVLAGHNKTAAAAKVFQQGLRLSRSLRYDRSGIRHLSLIGKIDFRTAVRTSWNTVPVFGPWGSVKFPARPEEPPVISNPPSGISARYLPETYELILECSESTDAIEYIIECRLGDSIEKAILDPHKPVYLDIRNNLDVCHKNITFKELKSHKFEQKGLETQDY
ncbi:tetratricopeptide repeat protein, partial [bacterium]|nr:tetratricopeptide repeat protein [bacterium]